MSHLKEKSQSFGRLTITQELKGAWLEGVKHSLSQEKKDELDRYLVKNPTSAATIRDFGEYLVDALMKITPSETYCNVLMKVEGNAYRLSDLKDHCPEYVIVGDYNWLSSTQDANYVAYAVSPFTENLETYCVGEQGRDLYPTFDMGVSVSVLGALPEPVRKRSKAS
jgi:hypothetical protein